MRVATGSVNGPNCPIYEGCDVVGTAPFHLGSGGSAAGCSTAAIARDDWRETAGLAGVLGLFAFAAARARRRR